MQLKQESCVAAIDADWARTACSAIVSGVVGRSASKQSSIQVRTRGAGGWRRPKSRRPRILQMDVFAFSQRPSTTSRGHTRPAVLFAGKCLMFQYAWHCLIYSGAYLFQFARHTALLLKTSSALPAHHCIRQARSAGLDASRFPAIPIPSHGAHCSSRMVQTDLGRSSWLESSHCLCIEGSPTSCQVVLQPSAVNRVALRDAPSDA
jgi:hypothetical protein